jgi:5-formyltetrahydrofolate cyclo-ligase
LENSKEKASLRKVLLERRDVTSADYVNLASQKIHNRLKQIDAFRAANSIGCYYPIGSEIKTQDIMQELLGDGKEVFLPKVDGDNMSFRKIKGLDDLEKGNFDIMEPKENCPKTDDVEIVLVPTVGITRAGIRIGYGYGFFDRYLSTSKARTISLTYSKQIVKSIPFSEKDIKIDWIVTEDEVIETSKSR